MPTPLPLPLTEELRTAAAPLHALLEPSARRSFATLARLAAKLTGTPIAVIGFVDGDRIACAATAGLDDEPALDGEFCRLVIADGAAILVADTETDARVAADPLVCGPLGIRALAGVPLFAADGAIVGIVAVADRRPRNVTSRQHEALVAVGEAIAEQFAEHHAAHDDVRAMDTDHALRGAELAMQNERLTAITSIAQQLFATLDSSLLVEALLAGVHELFGAVATLHAPHPAGGFVTLADLQGPHEAVVSHDEFITRAAESEICIVDASGSRAAVRIAGSSGGTAFILEVKRETPLGTADVFALGLLGQYVAVAARNVELYEELASRRDAVVELNQVKNDLIAMLAHDFKGPLTTIVGFADVLADDGRIDNESRAYLEMISSSAMRLASLATDTLALSRLEQNELVLTVGDVDLVALVRDVVRVFSVTRTIDLRASGGSLIVHGDEARLRQVFENLVGNAIKYSPGGESVEVALRARPRGVEVAIRDRGIGIPEDERGKLFGRFARASNARALGIGGTGFGLYLSRTIVELHGGSIEVQTTEGHGSTFRVIIPVQGVRAAASVRRVILLDVDGDTRSYVAHALRGDGFAVSVAHNGSDVLQQLDEGVCHAALIDADRLEMESAAFIERARGRTALVCMGLRRPAKNAGWDAFVTKPFLMKDLYTAIDEALVHAKGAARASTG